MVKLKKIVNDGLLSIGSSMMLVVSLQLIILPLTSKEFNIVFFGHIIIAIGLKNIISQVFAGPLNNLRLLDDIEIKEKEAFYNLCVVIVSLLAMLIIILCFIFYIPDFSLINKTFFTIATGLAVVNIFSNVFLRIKLEYKSIFKMQFFASMGYLLGYLLFLFWNIWAFIFLLPEIFITAYLLFKTPIIDFGILKNIQMIKSNWNIFRKSYFQLFFSNVIANIVAYLDRLILAPILSPVAVTQFYVGSLVAKTFSLGITPINGVTLSYLAKSKRILTKRFFNVLSLITLLFCITINFVLSLISPYVIDILYPNYYSDLEGYLGIINLVVTSSLLATILNPLLLKFAELKYQLKISLVHGIFYILLGIIFTMKWGLLGFCIISIFANIIKFLMIYYLGIKSIKQSNFQSENN